MFNTFIFNLLNNNNIFERLRPAQSLDGEKLSDGVKRYQHFGSQENRFPGSWKKARADVLFSACFLVYTLFFFNKQPRKEPK